MLRTLVARHKTPACTPDIARRFKFPALLLQRIGVCSVLSLSFAAFAPAPAHAWGCKGHQVVALIAEKHLNPHALAMVKKILADAPIDPNLSRYCKEGGADPMVDASTWPDDIRSQRPETPPWHYIDIPLEVKRPGDAEFCSEKGCVTSAIRDELATLRASDTNAQKKADDLRFLIHFVGDLHQPLHAVTNNDLGGNCVPVAFFDEQPQLRNQQLEIYSPNLHAVWDTNILERATMLETSDQVASELDQTFRRKIAGWQKASADVNAWAWESHLLAQKYAYGKLPVRIAIEGTEPVTSCADDNHIAARILAFNEQLADSYQRPAAPIVRERLAQAGARLALLLNQIWP